MELSQTNDDLHNVLAGLDNPVIIVGMDLRIRRYTSSAERLLNLVPGDMGRSISFLDGFCGSDIRTKVSQVIDSLTSVGEEVLCRNQRWYLLRVTPYKTLDHSIRGAVISLSDIDVRKRSTSLTRDVGEYAGKFLAAIHHPLLILKKGGREPRPGRERGAPDAGLVRREITEKKRPVFRRGSSCAPADESGCWSTPASILGATCGSSPREEHLCQPAGPTWQPSRECVHMAAVP
jgi:hypothetical protein